MNVLGVVHELTYHTQHMRYLDVCETGKLVFPSTFDIFLYQPFHCLLFHSTDEWWFCSIGISIGLYPIIPISRRRLRMYFCWEIKIPFFIPSHFNPLRVCEVPNLFNLKFFYKFSLKLWNFLIIITCHNDIIHISNQNWVFLLPSVWRKEYNPLDFACSQYQALL